MIFADAPDAVSQLISAWPTWVAAAPIIAAMLASVYLQFQAKIEAAKAAKLAAAKAEVDAIVAEDAKKAAVKVDAATAAAEEAVAAAKRAAETAHAAVARSARTEQAAVAERKTTAAKLDETLRVVNVVHTLVNSEMHVALTAAAVLARRVADLTGKKEDEAAADAADKKLAEHDAKQTVVDQGRVEVEQPGEPFRPAGP